jgi:predicted HicB family RNase H-like nuclease
MPKTPESRLQANARYHEKFERIPFRFRKDGSDGFTRQDLIEAAEAAGMSMNAFIIDALLERLRHY